MSRQRFLISKAARGVSKAAIDDCWERVSKDPERYWKHGLDPDTGEVFPFFVCSDGSRPFVILVREVDGKEAVFVHLAHELGVGN